MTSRLIFACPTCRTPLIRRGADEMVCPAHGDSFWRVEGIWRLLPAPRAAYFAQFMREYETVRRAEGRGSHEAAYYRALPFQDMTGRHSADWRIRARSYQTLLRRILQPLEEGRYTQARNRAFWNNPVSKHTPSLRILDLGAGNGWLAARLARRGHDAAAVDLLVNDFDGLGAHRHYDAPFTPVQAEFDHLPFAQESVEVVIFNASLHYSTCYDLTLGEALRVLSPDGTLIVLDSPIYRDGDSGRRMAAERESQFQRTHGFASNALASENYLTFARLRELENGLGLRWRRVQPFYGWRWWIRAWRAWLLNHREPARFMLLSAQKPESRTPVFFIAASGDLLS